VPMTREEAQGIAKQAAREAVKETFVSMGLDTQDPKEAQADMAFLRKQRKASDRIGWALRMAVYTTVATGLLSMLWVGFKEVLKYPPNMN